MLNLIKRNIYVVSATGVLLVLVVLLSLRWSQPDTARWVDEGVDAIAYPFQATFHRFKTGVSDLFRNYIYLVNLKQENERGTWRRLRAAATRPPAGICVATMPLASQEPRPEMNSASSPAGKKGGTVSTCVLSTTSGLPRWAKTLARRPSTG